MLLYLGFWVYNNAMYDKTTCLIEKLITQVHGGMASYQQTGMQSRPTSWCHRFIC